MRTWIAFLALVALSGCRVNAPGAFAPDAYYEDRFPVRATYADPTRRQIPPGDWLLLNYQIKNALPGEPKVTGDIVYRFDTDGDGSLDDTETVKELSLDYHHATTGANIWFLLEPLSVENARLDLKVLANNHVEASSGTGTVAVSIASGIEVSTARKFATRILDGRPTTIGGLSAYVVTYEIANVDQLRLSPDARWRRARVAFVRTPYLWVLRTRASNKFVSSWPVVAVVGYDADPNDFDAHLPEYGAFAGRLEFMDDQRAIVVHSDDLLKCNAGRPGAFTFNIDPDGTTSTALVDTSGSFCAKSTMKRVRFAPTGNARTSTQKLPSAAPADPATTPSPELVLPVVAPAPAQTPAPPS